MLTKSRLLLSRHGANRIPKSSGPGVRNAAPQGCVGRLLSDVLKAALRFAQDTPRSGIWRPRGS